MRINWKLGSPLLEAYIFRKVVVPALVVTVVLTGILSLERVLRVLELLANEGLPASLGFGLVVYLLPHYINLALPAGLLMGTLDGVRKLHTRSELVVMRTFRMPARQMLRPVLLLVAFFVIGAMLLEGYVKPHARHSFRAQRHAVVEGQTGIEAPAGVFRQMGKGFIFRAMTVKERGKHFGGVFVVSENAEERRFITAKEGIFMRRGEARILLLRDGIGMTRRFGTDDAMELEGQLEFQETELPLGPASAPYPTRGQDERELTLNELWQGRTVPEAGARVVRTELHQRLARIVALPVFGIVAFPLALIGGGRGGRAWGYLLGLALFVVYEKTFQAGTALAASGQLSPWLGVWGPVAALALLVGAVYHHYSGDRGRSIFGAMAAVWPQSMSFRGKQGGDR